MENFVKRKLTILDRLRYVKGAIQWLPLTAIPSRFENEDWRIVPFSFRDRWDCFWAGFETALLGYDYLYKKEGEG